MAAINFPDSPTVNQEFTVGDVKWVWTGVSWDVVAKTSDPFIVSETAPASPEQGDQWYDSNTGATFVYYDGFWVELNNSLPGPQGEMGPPGPTGAASTVPGPTGPTGPTGATGATGASGVISVTEPITNSGTSTSAVIGLNTTNIAPISSPTFTGNVSGNPASPLVANSAKAFGYIGLPRSSAATTGAYTIAVEDAGEHIYSTATRTVTIPSNASVAFEIGTTIVFISAVGATTTIAITSDTLILAGPGTTGSRTLAAHGMATAVKVAATTWYISGNGLT